MRTIIFISVLVVVALATQSLQNDHNADVNVSSNVSSSMLCADNCLDNCSVSWTTWAGELPADAVYVGDDLDGHALYVGRTYFNGALLPGKAKPNENRVIIGYNGVEYGDSQFQLLSGKNLTWQYVSYGHVPCNAVLGGRTADGKNLYIARFSVRGILLPGRVEPDLHNAFVSFGGKEYQSSFYDVLVEKK